MELYFVQEIQIFRSNNALKRGFHCSARAHVYQPIFFCSLLTNIFALKTLLRCSSVTTRMLYSQPWQNYGWAKFSEDFAGFRAVDRSIQFLKRQLRSKGTQFFSHKRTKQLHIFGIFLRCGMIQLGSSAVHLRRSSST